MLQKSRWIVDKQGMKAIIRVTTAVLLGVAALIAGCADGTTPMNTRSIEEKYLGMGEANRMYDYGELLLSEGRYQEAYTAFLGAEQNAYTSAVREAARKRRIWLGESIKAMEQGGQPLPAGPGLGEKPEKAAEKPAVQTTGGQTADTQILPGLKPGDPPIIIPGPPAAR